MMEQTEIARRMGISMNALKRILHYTNLSHLYEIHAGKRYYNYYHIVEALQKGKDEILTH